MKRLSTAIILAGGLGTRLRDVVPDLPKPMADVGGKPFLHHQLEYLISQGFSSVVISTGYKSDHIVDYISKSDLAIQVSYSHETFPLGTGGAIKKALTLITDQELVAIFNGDTYLPLNFNSVYALLDKNVPLTVISGPAQNHERRYSSISMDSSCYIIDDTEESPLNLVSLGCYIANPVYLSKELEQLPLSFSFESTYLPVAISRRYVKALAVASPFLDIGVPSDYSSATTFITQNKPPSTPAADILFSCIVEQSSILYNLANNDNLSLSFCRAVSALCLAIRNNSTIYAAGNGGSASDASHFVGELVSRLVFDRPPIKAESLTTDLSVITAIANDFSYDYVFKRQLEAKLGPNDVFVAISTSGKSENILNSIDYALDTGASVVVLTGLGFETTRDSDNLIIMPVPSYDTARIQESYQILIHALCHSVEYNLFGVGQC